MFLCIKSKLMMVACLVTAFPLLSNADELPQASANLPCSYKEYASVVTPYSVVTIIPDPKSYLVARWICVDGKLIWETGENDKGRNNFRDIEADHLMQGGKMVMRLDRAIVLRMVINEGTDPDAEFGNPFWLFDFRNKEPLVVGPMVAPYDGLVFSVIWQDDSVIVVFDTEQNGAGLDGHDADWSKRGKKFVTDIEASRNYGRESLPLMNRDGVYHEGKRNYVNMPQSRLTRKGKLIRSTVQTAKQKAEQEAEQRAAEQKGEYTVKNARSIYPAYLYEYKTKKLTAVAIEED